MSTVSVGPAAVKTVVTRPACPWATPREVRIDWATTCLGREQAWQLLNRPPFATREGDKAHPNAYPTGVGLLLDWLADQPGQTWQQRWIASGADANGRCWREIAALWLREHGRPKEYLCYWVFRALVAAIAVDLIRPSPFWLATATFRRGLSVVVDYRDPDGLSRLRALCAADADICKEVANRTVNRTALILAAKGGILADITPGDVLELFDAEASAHTASLGATHLFYRVLHELGGFDAQAPATLRELRALGQRTPEQLIDRYGLLCRPIRDLLVDYLRERQPALDYTSLVRLSYYLGHLFWADLERHHPGIDSLHLPIEVADAWKQRLRSLTKTTRDSHGATVQSGAERINYRACLTPVRAFYLDLSCWAVEDPARWGPWVAPCPVGSAEIDRRKDKRHLKSRMDARTRARLPVLPVLVESVDRRRKTAAALLDAARRVEPGQTFSAAGQTLKRICPRRAASAKTWAQDPQSGKRRDLGREEESAFWTYAAVEVLRSTGIRIEELTELSHHSLVRYRLPTSGELVPLLRITPSKTDAERLLVVSPELAEVLSAIISRVRGVNGAIPLVRAYDDKECIWSPPLPLLFQRRYGFEHRPINGLAIRKMLTAAIDHSGITDPATGEPLRFTPHDFRRLFITDVEMSGVASNASLSGKRERFLAGA
ncbi:tyrosine-type recombinase/integrase [Mycobacterium riyadhense]|uniref:tyrosine-type recombinase/integrase n=1 Tax=Mycobacterium riyadhense TaxID=486698 RepID=UPI00194FF4AF|nr:tyrosine-type recombinase/integrase [Mycobacterium riyadhense]